MKKEIIAYKTVCDACGHSVAPHAFNSDEIDLCEDCCVDIFISLVKQGELSIEKIREHTNIQTIRFRRDNIAHL